MDSSPLIILLFISALIVKNSDHSTCTGGYRVVYLERLHYNNAAGYPNRGFTGFFRSVIFFLWGYPKTEPYETCSANIADLKHEIGYALK